MDFPFFNRNTHQRGDHGFAHGTRRPERRVGIAFSQIFIGHFAIFQHQHAADVLAFQVILKIVNLTLHLIAGIGERFFCGQQWRSVAVAEHVPCVVAVVIAKAHHAIGLAPGEHGMCVRESGIERRRTGGEVGTVAGRHNGGREQAADNQRCEQCAVCFDFHIYLVWLRKDFSLRTCGL